MLYRILENVTVEQRNREEIKDLRLRKDTTGIVYLDVVLPNDRYVAILWFSSEGELHIAKNNTDSVGLKYIGE